MKCKVYATQQWIFFGIAADVNVAAAGDSHAHYSHASSFGWSAAQQQYMSGKSISCPAITVKSRDWVLLTADFDDRRLSLVSTQVSTAIELPLTMAYKLRHTAFFHIVLTNSGDSVVLLPVTSNGQLLLA